MKWEKIDGATREMGSGQPEYDNLFIRDDNAAYDFGPTVGVRETNFMRFCVSFSEDELRQLISGERLYVSIMGTRFAPISLTVGDPQPPEAPTND